MEHFDSNEENDPKELDIVNISTDAESIQILSTTFESIDVEKNESIYANQQSETSINTPLNNLSLSGAGENSKNEVIMHVDEHEKSLSDDDDDETSSKKDDLMDDEGKKESDSEDDGDTAKNTSTGSAKEEKPPLNKYELYKKFKPYKNIAQLVMRFPVKSNNCSDSLLGMYPGQQVGGILNFSVLEVSNFDNCACSYIKDVISSMHNDTQFKFTEDGLKFYVSLPPRIAVILATTLSSYRATLKVVNASLLSKESDFNIKDLTDAEMNFIDKCFENALKKNKEEIHEKMPDVLDSVVKNEINLQTFWTVQCELSEIECTDELCEKFHDISNKRRNPFAIRYKPEMCEIGDYSYCSIGEYCEYAHSQAEIDYHPAKYKTEICEYENEDGTTCKGNIKRCPKAHENSPHELLFTPFFKNNMMFNLEETVKCVYSIIMSFEKLKSVEGEPKGVSVLVVSDSETYVNCLLEWTDMIKDKTNNIVMNSFSTSDDFELDETDVVFGTSEQFRICSLEQFSEVKLIIVDGIITDLPHPIGLPHFLKTLRYKIGDAKFDAISLLFVHDKLSNANRNVIEYFKNKAKIPFDYLDKNGSVLDKEMIAHKPVVKKLKIKRKEEKLLRKKQALLNPSLSKWGEKNWNQMQQASAGFGDYNFHLNQYSGGSSKWGGNNSNQDPYSGSSRWRGNNSSQNSFSGPSGWGGNNPNQNRFSGPSGWGGNNSTQNTFSGPSGWSGNNSNQNQFSGPSGWNGNNSNQNQFSGPSRWGGNNSNQNPFSGSSRWGGNNSNQNPFSGSSRWGENNSNQNPFSGPIYNGNNSNQSSFGGNRWGDNSSQLPGIFGNKPSGDFNSPRPLMGLSLDDNYDRYSNNFDRYPNNYDSFPNNFNNYPESFPNNFNSYSDNFNGYQDGFNSYPPKRSRDVKHPTNSYEPMRKKSRPQRKRNKKSKKKTDEQAENDSDNNEDTGDCPVPFNFTSGFSKGAASRQPVGKTKSFSMNSFSDDSFNFQYDNNQ